MEQRWSCREFLPDQVPDEVLAAIFATAQRTASWCNTQAWGVHLLGGEALASFGKELGEHVMADPSATSSDVPLPERYVGAYADRRRGAGYALYESLGIERSDSEARALQMLRNFSFFGAPHVAIITTDRDHGVYGAVDCGGYVANLMNAALDVGVATIAQGAIAMYAARVRELLALPDDRLVICAVSLGLPAVDHPVNAFRTERATLADVVTIIEEVHTA
ncbi:MAG: nitroreductase [Cellulomonas sp.]|nr:nitroreductase [Cellulomonas sp.]